MHYFKFISLFFISLGSIYAQKTITFPSKDGITITADLYKITNNKAPYIVLCHLSEHSRAEYKDTAKKLNKLGYNCLAIDTRTGNEIFGIVNQTAIEAKKNKKSTDYLSSEQDILAAIDYAYDLNKQGIILFGSSFSASLALKIGKSNPKVFAVVAFSPGEHFDSKINLRTEIQGFNKPLFVTSSKKESSEVTSLVSDLKTKNKIQFIPIGEGAH